MGGIESRSVRIVALAALLLACHGPGLRAGFDRAVERSRIRVGDGPSDIELADVNGDGDLDVVVANQNDGDLQLLLGDGRGGLVPGARVPAGESPNDVAAADVDGDGAVDLAVSNHETDHVTVLLGDASGGFEPAPWSPVRVSVDPHPHTVVLTDLDRDGGVDLLVDDRGARGYRVFSRIDQPGFEPPGRLVDVGGDPYLGVAIADLDGDGRDDLVTPLGEAVAVVVQRPDSVGFRPPTHIPVTRPFAVGLGDLTGDGALDLVVAEAPGAVRLLRGTGDGGFSTPGETMGRVPGEAKAIAVGDFDGDGVDDAVVAGFESSELLVLFGGADGLRPETVSAGESPWGIAAGDLDGDGHDELLVTDYDGGMLDLFRFRDANRD